MPRARVSLARDGDAKALTRPPTSSWRAAFYYGLWTALCLSLTIAVIFELRAFEGGLYLIGVVTLPTVLIACIGWALLHRGGRKAGWIGYIALAIGVVLLGHIVVASVMLFPANSEKTNLVSYLAGVLLTIQYHVLITVAVAVAGTALFVWWRRRAAG